MTTMLGLYVEFKAKSKEVDDTFKKMSSEIDKLKGKQSTISSGFQNMTNKVMGLGRSILQYGKWVALGITASAAGLWILLGKIGDSIDKITDTARGLGVSAQAFQSLGYAASLSGVSMDELEMSLKKINVAIGQASSGNKEMVDTFASIGLSAFSLKGLSLDQQFITVANAIGKMTDKNQQASVAMQLFGRGYVSVLNMIRDGVTDNIKEFDKLGLALTDSQRKAVDSFGDSKNRLGAIWQGFSQKVVGYVSPAFTRIIDYISDTILQMGGIDKAAQSFAQAIVTGVKDAISAIRGLISGLNEIYKVFLDIQQRRYEVKLENLKDTEHGAGKFDIRPSQFTSNADFISNLHGSDSYIPGIGYEVEKQHLQNKLNSIYKASNNAYSSGQGSTDKFLEGLEKSVDKAGKEIGSTIPNYLTASNAVQKLGDAATKASDSITNAFDSLNSSSTNEHIQKWMSPSDSDAAWASSTTGQFFEDLRKRENERFDELGARLLADLKSGMDPQGARIQSGIATLKGWAKGNMSSYGPGQLGAVDELEKYASSLKRPEQIESLMGRGLGVQGALDSARKAFDKQEVKVDISVSSSPEFIVKINSIASTAQSSALFAAAKSMGTK
jgi:hypothetical protein